MKTSKKENELISLGDAAEELATTGLRLLMLIREGALAGVETDGEWRIRRESVDRLKRTGVTSLESKGCGAACSATNCDRHR